MRSFLAALVATMLVSCGGEPADVTESPTAFLGVVDRVGAAGFGAARGGLARRQHHLARLGRRRRTPGRRWSRRG